MTISGARRPAFALFGLLLVACAPRDGVESRPVDPRPRVVALGTAQDGGLPHAGCRCAHCRAAKLDPDRRRLVSSLAIVLPDSDRVYLIDATPDLREQLDVVRDWRQGRPEGTDRSPVDGVLLTHAHMGHYTGLAFFGFEALHTRRLPVYASRSMGRFLRDNGPWSQLVNMQNVVIEKIRPGEPFPLADGVTVVPVAVPHRDEYSDTLGFVIRGPETTLLYLPDTDAWTAWDPPLEELLDGIDVALLDGTFYSTDELPGRDTATIGHPLIAASMDRFGARVRDGSLRVYFTHLNHSNPALDPAGGALAEIERRGFHVLRDGDVFPL